jgi:hypothetical protein
VGDARVPFAILLDAFGVPATVTVPNGGPVEAQGIWVTPTTDDRPGSLDVRRREPTRTFALATPVPRGTVIVAPEMEGLDAQRWRVDGFAVVEVDHVRVLVIPDPEV